MIVDAFGDQATELRLGGDVETVGRFVEEEIVGMEGEGASDERLLLLPERHSIETTVGVEVELVHEVKESSLSEIGIERSEVGDIVRGSDVVGKGDLVGEEDDVLEE